MAQQMSLFDSQGEAAVDVVTTTGRSPSRKTDASKPKPVKPAKMLARRSHPATSQMAAEKVAANLTNAMLFALGWVEESLSDPRVSDVTSYEVDELANRDFQTYRGFALPDRVCGKRFGDLKEQGFIADVGTRASRHKDFRGGRGLVECFELTDAGRLAIQQHEKWWLNQTAGEHQKSNRKG